MDDLLYVTPSPHLRSGESVKKIMWTVVIALLPAGIAGIYIFGMHALLVLIVSVLSAIGAEVLVMRIRKLSPNSILDGSAIITGLLVGYNLPPGVPLWLPVCGSVFGIIVGKHLFGGIGLNIFNPALAGRAFLMASWPIYMTSWTNPRWFPDSVSTATPLNVLKDGVTSTAQHLPNYLDLLFGNRPGCIGEVCIIALLIGAMLLLFRRCISWHIPFSYLVTVGILSWIFMGDGLFNGDWLFYILSGGLVLGAFFMATDMVTTPFTKKGHLIFGVGCGILTFLIRKWGGYPEGVSYSILMMNAATPIIDRYTTHKKFGFRKR